METAEDLKEAGMLPSEHISSLISSVDPICRRHENENPVSWQNRSRRCLYDLLGIGEIEPFRTDPQIVIEFDEIREAEGFREVRFRFMSENNVSVPCHLLQPVGVTERRPVVICLQGHSTGMHISLRRFKYPGDENTAINGDRDFAVRAVKEGYCAVAMEQRCFGECGGNSDNGHPECSFTGSKALILGRTLVGERVWDIMRLIDVLESQFADIIDPQNIICLGNSGGGTATVYACAMEPRIALGVPSCAVSTFHASIGNNIVHCLCNYIPSIAKYFDMGELLALAAPRPMVVVSGLHDGIFPIEQAKECVAIAATTFRDLGADGNIVHVIGQEGHRFYADAAWPYIHRFIGK